MDWDLFLKTAILVLYVVGMLLIAYFTRKRSKTVGDTLLGNRSMGGWLTAFAYGTTYFSAVIFIGYAGEQGYAFGFHSLWIGVGNALIGAALAWLLLGKRTRNTTVLLGTKTMPEYFSARYDDKYLKLFSALVVVVFLLPYSASVYTGLGYLFKSVFNIDFIWVVLAMAALTAVYLFFGGYFATAVSDFAQGLIMLVGVVVMIAFVFNYEAVGGFVEGLSHIAEKREELGLGISGTGVWQLVALVLLTSLGSWGLPQIVHKFHTVKDESAIKKATWVSTAFALIIGVGAYLVGCTAVLIFENAAAVPVDQRIPELLAKTLPAGLLGLIAVLVLSASMSTLSGLTLSVASAAGVDIMKGYIKKDAPDKTVNLTIKLVGVIVIAISAGIAVYNDFYQQANGKATTIVNLMSLSWGVLAGAFIGPYIYGLYSKRATKAGAYASMIGTLVLTAALYIVSKTVPSAAPVLTPPAIGVFTMAYSMLVVPVVSRFTRRPPQALVDKVFAAAVLPVGEVKEADAAELHGEKSAEENAKTAAGEDKKEEGI
ncbi:MAG: sodium:solute symporter [Bacillota bacterium]|nr:MAG: sodium:solute symporter [Bacillota bacterium]